jgi:hypothetical protein
MPLALPGRANANIAAFLRHIVTVTEYVPEPENEPLDHTRHPSPRNRETPGGANPEQITGPSTRTLACQEAYPKLLIASHSQAFVASAGGHLP